MPDELTTTNPSIPEPSMPHVAHGDEFWYSIADVAQKLGYSSEAAVRKMIERHADKFPDGAFKTVTGNLATNFARSLAAQGSCNVPTDVAKVRHLTVLTRDAIEMAALLAGTPEGWAYCAKRMALARRTPPALDVAELRRGIVSDLVAVLAQRKRKASPQIPAKPEPADLLEQLHDSHRRDTAGRVCITPEAFAAWCRRHSPRDPRDVLTDWVAAGLIVGDRPGVLTRKVSIGGQRIRVYAIASRASLPPADVVAAVLAFVAGRETVTMREIDIPTRAHRKTLEAQIAAVLRANGWVKARREQGNVWIRAS